MEVTSTSTATSSISPTQTGISGLTADDFFTLLVTQLQSQDPTEPVTNSELLSQLSTMRGLQSNIELGDTLKSVAESLDLNRLSQGAAFLGQTVTLNDHSIGRVDMASVVGGVPTVSINGEDIPLSRVQGVVTPESYVGQIVGVTADTDSGLEFGKVSALEDDNGQSVLQIERVDADGERVKFSANVEDVQKLFTHGTIVGKQIQAISIGGELLSGTASAARTPDGKPALLVSGELVTLDQIIAIGEAPADG